MDEVFFYGLPEKTTKPLVLLNLTSVLKRKVPTKIDSKCEMDSSSFSDADCSSSNDFDTAYNPEQCENGNESSQTDTESAHSSSSSETDSNSSSDADSSSSCDSDEDYMPEDDHYLSVDEKRQSSLRKRPIKITLKLDSDGNYTKS